MGRTFRLIEAFNRSACQIIIFVRKSYLPSSSQNGVAAFDSLRKKQFGRVFKKQKKTLFSFRLYAFLEIERCNKRTISCRAISTGSAGSAREPGGQGVLETPVNYRVCRGDDGGLTEAAAAAARGCRESKVGANSDRIAFFILRRRFGRGTV